MIDQLILALVLTGVTVICHVAGTVYAVLPASGIWSRTRRHGVSAVWGLTRLVGALLVLHLVEILIWAGTFAVGGLLPDLETAVYFSLKSYTTVGYGDVLLPQSWRLLGPIEAAVGVLMLGLSTSVIVTAMQRLYNLRPQDAQASQPPSTP